MVLAGLAVVPGLSANDLERPDGMAKTADLIAGGGNAKGAKDVGDIFVWNDGTNIYVQFFIVDSTPANPLDDWFITETHVEVASAMGSIPQANGNPIPGQFTYVRSHDNVDSYVQVIPLGSFTGTVCVAAHATVCQGGSVGLDLALPEEVMVKTPTPFGVKTSTFPGIVVSGGTFLDGTYADGWCARLGIGQMPYDTWYPGTVYSSYADDIPASVIENQANLDAVNWLLNHKGDFLGRTWTLCPAPLTAPSWWTSEMGTYDPSVYPTEVTVSWFDFQMAIWYLLDNELTYDPEYCFMHQIWLMQSKVGHDIAQQALQNGEGFVPGCGQSMALIIAPVTGVCRDQPVLVEVRVPCACCETAWAAISTNGVDEKGRPTTVWGYQFPGKNWGAYIRYTVTS